MFGAETILMNRCTTEELFNQTVSMINNFKNYFLSHGEPVGENPSPGNKAGGISTLEDKALGCTQKCGKAPVNGVMEYGDRLQNPGLNLLSAPGNDLVAATALASCGCHLVLFTTGRGTPFGTFVPTMKIATNPDLASRKKNWIDFSAGHHRGSYHAGAWYLSLSTRYWLWQVARKPRTKRTIIVKYQSLKTV